MTTFTSTNGKYIAKLTKNVNYGYTVLYCQLSNTGIGIEEDLIDCKTYSTENKAMKFINSKIN